MTADINSPVATTLAPSAGLDKLFRSQAFLSRSTGALTDDSAKTFPDGVANGLYMAYVADSTDKLGWFTITGGDTVTIAVDAGTDFSTTFENDGTVNIDISSGDLRVDNQLGSTATIELVRLL